MSTLFAAASDGALASTWDATWKFLNEIYHLMVTRQLLDYLPNVLIACILSALIGWDRQRAHKTAGIRTHLVIGAAAALLTLCGVITAKTLGLGDPTRIAAQILSGIGFIGAGVILKKGIRTSGVTTAATIFLAVAVGVACGFDMFSLATAVTLLVIGSLKLVTRLFASTEYCQPVIVTCKATKLDQVRLLFGRNCFMGAFVKKGDMIECTIAPQMTVFEYEALLKRLVHDEDVISVVPEDGE